MGLVNNFLIGCDPEFAVRRADGRVLYCNRHDDGSECSTLVVSRHGSAGYDHGGLVGELRPTPELSALAVTKHLAWLLMKTPWLEPLRKRRDVVWIAGPFGPAAAPDSGVGIGGHVHLDVEPVCPPGRHEWSQLTPRIVLGLDAFERVTECLALYDPALVVARRRHGYGQFRNWRQALTRHDTQTGITRRRLEYRTYPSWLSSPETAMLFLTASKLAAVEPKFWKNRPRRKPLWSWMADKFRALTSEDDDAAQVSELLQAKPQQATWQYRGEDIRPRWKTAAWVWRGLV